MRRRWATDIGPQGTHAAGEASGGPAAQAGILILGEELGRRGYLQHCLLFDPPSPVAVATGATWGIWRYPRF